jgi:pimeloyl-ACP methyl ester carboxylesterase
MKSSTRAASLFLLTATLVGTPLAASAASASPKDRARIPRNVGLVRVAHLVPDAPAVDLCVKSGRLPFLGPVLKTLGTPQGISYGQVSRYVPLPAGTYSIRVVAPGAADCNTPLAGLADTEVKVGKRSQTTVAATGDLASFQLTPYAEQPSGEDEDNTSQVKFVHASPGTPAVDVGFGYSTNFTPAFTNVPFRGAAPTGETRYASVPAADYATISARATGTTDDAIVVDGLPLPAGQRTTAFAIGKIGDAKTPLSLLVCADKPFAPGALSECETFAGPSASRSRLDATASLPEFGNVKYRAPKAGSDGPELVLYHGIFGGASHRSYSEVLSALDAKYRVWLVDLPGAGDSDKLAKSYDIAAIDRAVESFLVNVVQHPAYVVGESLTATAVLDVAGSRPDLVKGVVLLSPQGIKNLAGPPSPRQQGLYDQFISNPGFGIGFYSSLFVDPGFSQFSKGAYFNDALATDAIRRAEAGLAAKDLDRRFLAFSFVGGQIYKPFAAASANVKQPVLAIFGAQAEAVGIGQPIDTPAEFQAIRPDFRYESVDQAGQSVQREQPNKVVELIDSFIK